MRLYFLLPTYFLLFIPVESWSGPYYPVQKNKTVRVFTALISNWLSSSSYFSIFNAIDPVLYGQSNCSTIGGRALSSLSTALTPAQYSQVLSVGATLTLQLGPTGVAQALVILKNLLWNNVCYFMFQELTWVANNKANHTEDGFVANAYRLANEFTTFQRIKTIVLRAQSDYVAAGYWTPIRNSAIGNTWLLLSQYGTGSIGVLAHVASLIYMIKTSAMHNLFGYLCISNAISSIGQAMIMAFYVGPFTIIQTYEVSIFLNSMFAQMIDQLTYVSQYVHMIKSFNRFFTICRLMNYSGSDSKRRIRFIIILVWLISLIQGLPFFISDCAFYYDATILLWAYSQNDCGAFISFYIDFLLPVVTMAVVFITDTFTLIFFRYQLKKRKLPVNQTTSNNTYEKQKRKRDIIFFTQNYITTILYILILISFNIISPQVPMKWGSFFTTTIALELLIMLDGINMTFFARKVYKKSIFPVRQVKSLQRT